ncbi:MAG TPA: hypothetical protein VNW47_02085 [Terriglobales bacterium]|jgi:hypothetical protein|nr:hypothetical protein [Terriglobales bacterium]
MKTLLLAAALLLSTEMASAATTTQKWTAGWDNFAEPLNFTKSKIKWSVNPTAHKLTVTFTLVGATPSKLYQVGIVPFCTTFPATFGQFPVDQGGGTCQSLTRQGVTATAATIELGVVTTDLHGNGSFTVIIGPIAAGTYNVEFQARNGAGCNLIGGAGNQASDCEDDFQSPGPFGTTTAITVP